MKTTAEIKQEILEFATKNANIRAVYLEGSRTNPTIAPDEFQDYDVVLVVNNFSEFIKDGSWTEMFGGKLIEQQPETFSFGGKIENFFSYLILYKAGFRIDFSVIPVEKIDDFNESLREIWLDKDGIYQNFPPSSDRDFWVKKPDERWFQEVCNEFWWVCTYVAKGLARNEIPYAIKHREEILRPMLIQMLDWDIGFEYDFKISTGKVGKFYPKYLSQKEYAEFLITYSDSKAENIWNSLFKMTEIFSKNAKKVAAQMNFNYKISEEQNILQYLNEIKNNSSQD